MGGLSRWSLPLACCLTAATAASKARDSREALGAPVGAGWGPWDADGDDVDDDELLLLSESLESEAIERPTLQA